MVTITSHIFRYIFQTVHFSAVTFTRGNEKNMSFLLISKSPKVWKNLKQSDRAPLMCYTVQDSVQFNCHNLMATLWHTFLFNFQIKNNDYNNIDLVCVLFCIILFVGLCVCFSCTSNINRKYKANSKPLHRDCETRAVKSHPCTITRLWTWSCIKKICSKEFVSF